VGCGMGWGRPERPLDPVLVDWAREGMKAREREKYFVGANAYGHDLISNCNISCMYIQASHKFLQSSPTPHPSRPPPPFKRQNPPSYCIVHRPGRYGSLP
jgi:hypothetical protein